MMTRRGARRVPGARVGAAPGRDPPIEDRDPNIAIGDRSYPRARAPAAVYDPAMARGTLFALCSALAIVALEASAADPNNITGSAGIVMIDKRGGYVRFFDAAARTEVAALELASPPHELAISPDHKIAYVPLYGDGVYGANPHPGHSIVMIDLDRHAVVDTIDVSPYVAPHGLQVDASGTLYASCDLSRKLLVIDPKKRTIEAAIDTDGTGHWAAVLPDGSKAYVANKNDRDFVSVIDLKARKMIGRVPMPNGTQGITASPDGRQVLAMDFSEPRFYVIDTVTDRIVETVEVEGNTIGPFRARFSPDGRTLITVNHVDSLANIYDGRDFRKPQMILGVGRQAFGIAYSPDGRTALVSNHGDGTISVIDLGTHRVVDTFTAGTGIETLSYY
jgi:YVTN family beta-propeller protein